MIEIIQPEGQQEAKQEPQTATEILRAVQDDICINYCKYQPTTDKDGFAIFAGQAVPARWKE